MALPAPGYLSNAERTNAEMNQALEDQRDFIAGIVGAVSTLTASAALTANQLGLVLIDATAGNLTVTLPESNAALGVRDVIVRRVDGSANSATIPADGTDKIMLDTTTSPAGQASVSLLYRDDWLRLRSDGAGKWWVVGGSTASRAVRAALLNWTAIEVGGSNGVVDASSGFAPGGSAISPTDAELPWIVGYPALVGWNGEKTCGLRVDSARHADNALGVGQTWQDFTVIRGSGVTYTNNTGRTIYVAVSIYDAGNGTSTFTIDNSIIPFSDFSATGEQMCISLPIPAGSTYKVTLSGAGVSAWLELRT